MILTWTLAIATFGGFILALYEVVKSERGKALSMLTATFILCLFLGGALWGYLKQEAENRALTDPQLRAEKLVQEWGHDKETDFTFLSRGDAEGIVVAATDLMEDLKECRPEAFETAHNRLNNARERSEEVRTIPTDYTFESYRDERAVWTEAAAAAYGQVKGVSIAPPNCGGRL